MIIYDECTIWEACRATSAASTFFEPVTIGRGSVRFVDGRLRHNNPVTQVFNEATDIWPERIDTAVLLTIGTGQAPGPSISRDTNIRKIVNVLKEIVTDADNEGKRFAADHRILVDANQLYRFSVEYGLADVKLQEWKESSRERIYASTTSYLTNPNTRHKRELYNNKILETPCSGMALSSQEMTLF